MKIIRSLTDIEDIQVPVALTIGNFDGIHLGHQTVINKLKAVAKSDKIPSTLITFENHPAEILRPGQTILRLCTLKHRLKLLEEARIDVTVLLTFTQELAEQTAEAFIDTLQNAIPFSHLVLGHDARVGKDRQGDRHKIIELAKHHHFSVEYLEPFTYQGLPVSSSKIRETIQKGDFDLAEKLLGRKYSIYSMVKTGLGHGKKIGFPTANIDVSGLALPLYGVYAVKLVTNGNSFPGVANLGIAPTIRQENKPILEVHLFNSQEELYGKNVEVVFYKYLRPEMKFDSIDNLKKQIATDVEKAKLLLA